MPPGTRRGLICLILGSISRHALQGQATAADAKASDLRQELEQSNRVVDQLQSQLRAVMDYSGQQGQANAQLQAQLQDALRSAEQQHQQLVASAAGLAGLQPLLAARSSSATHAQAQLDAANARLAELQQQLQLQHRHVPDDHVRAGPPSAGGPSQSSDAAHLGGAETAAGGALGRPVGASDGASPGSAHLQQAVSDASPAQQQGLRTRLVAAEAVAVAARRQAQEQADAAAALQRALEGQLSAARQEVVVLQAALGAQADELGAARRAAVEGASSLDAGACGWVRAGGHSLLQAGAGAEKCRGAWQPRGRWVRVGCRQQGARFCRQALVRGACILGGLVQVSPPGRGGASLQCLARSCDVSECGYWVLVV